MNSETDFVARNEAFQSYVGTVTKLALAKGDDIEALKGARLSRHRPHGGRGADPSYRHHRREYGAPPSEAGFRYRRAWWPLTSITPLPPASARSACIVGLEFAGDAARLTAFGRQLAMHVAAANPQFLDIASVDKAAVERERDILRDQARQSGKPEAIIEKMVEGRLRKFYEETVLLEQIYVIDGESRLGKVVEAAGKEVGAPIKVTGFVRFALGEGIDKKESDFAAEVAAQLKG